jgi:enoyl-CoA hydratase/carnithine racemase
MGKIGPCCHCTIWLARYAGFKNPTDFHTMTDEILFELQDGIGLITLNRPAAMNTLSGAMMDGLGALYRRCDEDNDVRVVVVTGAGEAFCAGADMSAGGETFDAGGKELDFSSCPLSFQAWDVRKPVIAACNGHAIGVGLGIALQADMRVFAEQGKYGFLQNRRGVVADFACEYLLPRLVGFERAFELVVRAPRLSGAQALDWGLAARVLPAGEVLDAALEIARDMVENCSPLVMGMHKRLLWRALDMEVGELIGLETRALHHSMEKPDAVEGGMAYLERRAPQWQSTVNEDWPQWMP